ncbi:MAG: NAD-dependent epimerase/dehydratase family protein [Burkholderiales bacterium]|jgi:UDP-glucose 4-epimerase
MNVSIIAGGAGFVGCNLLPLLAKEDRYLVVLDNLCRGREDYIDAARATAPGRVKFINVDLSDRAATIQAFDASLKIGTVDEVWHLEPIRK